MNESNTKAVKLEPLVTKPTEHNILLNLTSETDRVIYDNLIYSNYNCLLLNPKQAQCSQFHEFGEVIASSRAKEIYDYKSADGQSLRVYELASGEAHIEFKLTSSKTLYRYSFSSVEQIPLFARKPGLFTTGSIEWDISSLENTL